MGSCVSRDLFTSAHKDCPMPQGMDPLNPDLPSGHHPTIAPDHVTGKDKQMDFCWDPWQRCFQTTNGYLSDSRSCSSNYNVAALATSSLVGVVQSIKDHITKPTAMARGRVAHLIEWKGWRAQRSGWELSPADDEHYCCLPDELREARFAAGVAEQFAITEATLSAWSSLDDEELHPENSPQDIVQLQDLESVYLQDSLLSGPSQDDSLLAFSSPGLSPDGWPSPDEPPITPAVGTQPPSPEPQHGQRLPRARGLRVGPVCRAPSPRWIASPSRRRRRTRCSITEEGAVCPRASSYCDPARWAAQADQDIGVRAWCFLAPQGRQRVGAVGTGASTPCGPFCASGDLPRQWEP